MIPSQHFNDAKSALCLSNECSSGRRRCIWTNEDPSNAFEQMNSIHQAEENAFGQMSTL
jgi:hypothetical protein